MRMMIACLVWATTMGANSARLQALVHGDDIGIKAERKPSGYAFTFRRCGTSEDATLPFLIITVEEVRPDGHDDLICYVEYVGKGHQPTSDATWRYGSVPPGYVEHRGCKPLKAEKTYRVSVAAGGAQGGALVRIDKKGVPTVTMDDCDNRK